MDVLEAVAELSFQYSIRDAVRFVSALVYAERSASFNTLLEMPGA